MHHTEAAKLCMCTKLYSETNKRIYKISICYMSGSDTVLISEVVEFGFGDREMESYQYLTIYHFYFLFLNINIFIRSAAIKVS